MTTKPRGRAFRRQFLPLLRKQSGLEILHFFGQSVGSSLVGALFPPRPYSFVRSRQHGPDFPGFPAPLLAPCSRQGIISSSDHANMARFFPACRRPCWRPVPRKALFLRPVTPTWPGFSRLSGAHAGALVGALFSAKKNLHPGSNLGLAMGFEPIGKRLLNGCRFSYPAG